MENDLNDLQLAYLNAPKVGAYYYNSLAPKVYECVARIMDKFVSPISGNVILELKQIHWQHAPQEKFEISSFYMAAERFQDDDYQEAMQEHIQRFEKIEVAELKNKKQWKKLR